VKTPRTLLRLKPRKPLRNWVSPHDVRNLLELPESVQHYDIRRPVQELFGHDDALTTQIDLHPRAMPSLVNSFSTDGLGGGRDYTDQDGRISPGGR
jgi:hypothetical protein